MPVPNQFANVTTSIPLSQLDANFNTPITLGNTAIQLGNTVTTLNNMTLANVTVSSGNVTITNVTVTTANVTTANIATAQIANVTVSGTGTFAAGSNTAPSITTSGDTNTGIFFPAADTVAIGTGGTEALRVNSSQNVGVGTISPGGKFNVDFGNFAGVGARFQYNSSNTPFCINALNSAGEAYIAWNAAAKSSSDTATRVLAQAATKIEGGGGQFIFYNTASSTAGSDITWTQQMRLDSSGNLGLGVTPSAWQANNRAVQLLEGWASLSANNSQGCCDLANNGYNSGSSANNLWKYTNGSQPATLYQQNAGQHRWFYAASGAANATITFTQAMTLDASGNLGIGTASPVSRLAVNLANTAFSPSQTSAIGGSNATRAQFTAAEPGVMISTDINGSGTQTGSSTISMGMQIGLYNTNDIRNQIWWSGGYPLTFTYSGTPGASPSERARILSSGEFLIGQTSSVGARLQVGGYTGNYASSTGLGVNGNTHFENGLRISALAGTGSRTVTADANGTLSAASDSSLKQEVMDVQVGGLAELMQVQPKAYKWLSDIEERGEEAAVEFGFFADLVAPIIPSAAPKGNDELYGFYDRAMIAVMTKAIQELNAKVEAQAAEIAALKGNA